MNYKIKSKKVYDGFVKILESRIFYNFNNKDQEIVREVILEHSSVAIILYNKEKDTTILVKQFRPAVHFKNQDPYMIELVAGRIDEDNSKKNIIIKEVKEEAGYEIKDVQFLKRFFSSPGANTEFVYLYLGYISDKNKISDGGGDENENIEVIEIPFYDAYEMVKSNEILDGKTILGLELLKNIRRDVAEKIPHQK